MLDLSNNNGGPFNFEQARQSGQARLYHKLSEGADFHDADYASRAARATRAGFKVGPYHFARPSRWTPREEAEFFLSHMPALKRGVNLRPCLDLEDPRIAPSTKIGRWAQEWIAIVHKHTGHTVVVYGSPSYLQECRFSSVPGPLWVAEYGAQDDGRNHGFSVPKPWKAVAAHQYTARGHCPGITGPCDLSKVYHAKDLDVSHSTLRRLLARITA